ncbi:MAG: hypothetical protein D6719_12225 [Candidatus Dadabacteria bacterium]|nr:MAG: hypothetical protein D6719_12225 [Candidatus Dadabacteria bacterium]
MAASGDRVIETVTPGSFDPVQHYYTRVLNAAIHPLVNFFLRLPLKRLVSRYCHLNPRVDPGVLEEILHYSPRFFRWAGADLLHVTTSAGNRRMVVIETNSSPSGQKSMPLFAEHQEQGGYRFLIDRVFAPALKAARAPAGALAVIYDKNYMEASGYAAAMADYFDEQVYLVPFFQDDHNRYARVENRILGINMGNDWIPLRAAFRYVTQKPWNRLPHGLRTFMLNPVICCLAGGRNKMVAAIAYDLFNSEIAGSGLQIKTPETVREVSKAEVPLLVKKFGGFAVVKIPYSNAGQGVFTVTSPVELEAFMQREFHYDRFIVQSLIGNYQWSSEGAHGKYYHVGTVPDRNNHIYVADLRMMVGATPNGYAPVAVYARRAAKPLADNIVEGGDSWSMLGTNLSVKLAEDKWDSDTSRLLLMDRRDFNRLGIGLDELLEAFVQTVMASVAIDKMACNLVTKKGSFRYKLFSSLNDDKAFISEIIRNDHKANE